MALLQGGTTIYGTGTVQGALTVGGEINTSTVASTSTVTGALVVAGGIGLGGGIYAGGVITATNMYVGVWPVSTGTTSGGSSITGTNSSFLITNNTLSTSTTTGALVVAGGIAANGNAYISSFLTVSGNGSATTSTGALVNFIGNLGGNYIAPQNNGVILQMTGQVSNPARVYIDGQGTGNYSAIIGRHYNGTTAAPAGLNFNDIIFRLGGTPYNTSGWPAISTVRWDMVADETQTANAQGSRIDLWITPRGSSVTNITRQASFGTTGTFFYNTVTANSMYIGIWPVSTGTSTTSVSGGSASSTGTTSSFLITNTTQATSTTTGALVVAGGVGISGNLYVYGGITATQLTIAYTTITQSLITSPDIFTITNTTPTTSPSSGALVVNGGVGVGGGLYAGGVITATNMYVGVWPVSTGTTSGGSNITGTNNSFLITNTTPTTSTTTGALVVSGGVGVGGGIYANGVITATNVYVGIWPVSTSTSGGSATSASTATTATNLAGGASGSIPIQSATGQTAFIPIGTAGYILSSNGTTATWISTGSLATSNTLFAGTYSASLSSVNGAFSIPNQLVSNTGTGSVTIIASPATGSASTWTFGVTGGLTFPDNTVQTTAYTGGGGGSASTGTTSSFSISSNLSVSGVSSFAGIISTGLSTLTNTLEILSNVGSVSGATTLSYTSGQTYYVTPSATWSIAFTNVPTNPSNYSTILTVVVNQGSTAYTATSITINGSAVTPKWANGTPWSGNANHTDVVSYGVLNLAGTFNVVAQYSTFA